MVQFEVGYLPGGTWKNSNNCHTVSLGQDLSPVHFEYENGI